MEEMPNDARPEQVYDPYRIERQIYIAAPAEKVWEALITPSIASRYFIVPLLEADPRPGGRIVYDGGGQLLEYEVLECEPGTRLVHSFTIPMIPEDPPSRISYELEAIGDMCKLTLVHDGFPSRNRTYNEVKGGWNFIISNLKTLLESGNTLPWPKSWT